ncbi:hypothetical protein P6F34_gp08 [Pseudomonas phage MiCath]|uniref:Uncharacterized protein n=1 Tax=Pseudomonas phage MiCath TaxID=3003729 RepID=A0AAF0AFV9_9CAUD|nr:hypothetical protein P6F34_gp08 [Pseudomonas phage MiCath]WAX22362.1 hypothetical protein [Pseudomonas phage MiCath]
MAISQDGFVLMTADGRYIAASPMPVDGYTKDDFRIVSNLQDARVFFDSTLVFKVNELTGQKLAQVTAHELTTVVLGSGVSDAMA